MGSQKKVRRKEKNDAEEQRRLHEAAAKVIGAIRGGDPYRAENAGKVVKEIIRKRHGR